MDFKSVDLEEVSERIGLTPSQTQLETRSGRRLHVWFLGTRGNVDSRDSRRHIDWLLDRIEPSSEAFRDLLRQAARFVVLGPEAIAPDLVGAIFEDREAVPHDDLAVPGCSSRRARTRLRLRHLLHTGRIARREPALGDTSSRQAASPPPCLCG